MFIAIRRGLYISTTNIFYPLTHSPTRPRASFWFPSSSLFVRPPPPPSTCGDPSSLSWSSYQDTEPSSVCSGSAPSSEYSRMEPGGLSASESCCRPEAAQMAPEGQGAGGEGGGGGGGGGMNKQMNTRLLAGCRANTHGGRAVTDTQTPACLPAHAHLCVFPFAAAMAHVGPRRQSQAGTPHRAHRHEAPDVSHTFAHAARTRTSSPPLAVAEWAGGLPRPEYPRTAPLRSAACDLPERLAA
eukprot:GHVU01185560.1.p1 GENE.GHVU01185560.1~~GHVU01185560.1.p1  ORF type:complete len:242 (-),score=23.69 GHVU01185560.1:90-815(-)